MNEPQEPAPRKAVALRYEAEHDTAPRIIAKGQRLTAERIIAIAKEHGIHVHEDADLVALLAKLDINSPIPEELYRAVAAVLAFVYHLNKRMEPHRAR